MHHLHNQGPAGSHLDLADIEPEPEQSLEERALAVGLAAQGDYLRDGELLAERDGGRLQAVVGLEAGGGGGGRVEGVGVVEGSLGVGGLRRGSLGGRGDEGVGGRHG